MTCPHRTVIEVRVYADHDDELEAASSIAHTIADVTGACALYRPGNRWRAWILRDRPCPLCPGDRVAFV